MTLVTKEVSAEELKEMFSKEYIPWKSICQTKRTYVMQEVNSNLNEDICTAQLIFVENILSSNIKENQST